MRPAMTAAFGVVVAVLILGLAVRLYMGRPAEDRLLPGERIGIAELAAPLPPNAFLACPAGYCRAPGAPSPVFAMPWTRLAEYWAELVAHEPRVVEVVAEPDRQRIVLVQRSLVFRFPDIITVEFVALSPDRSSLAIYSRARYGKSDFGTNRKRVKHWLALLQQTAGGR
jgi:hypothetical protein